MEVEVRFFGDGNGDKYKIETYGNSVEISRIHDTTNYSAKDIKNTEEITKIIIPRHDLSTLVLSLQKILY